MSVYVYSTMLEVVDCGVCGIPFGIPRDLYTARLGDGRNFYCPNGHSISYRETETARYKRLYQQARDAASAARAERDQAEASRRAWKGQATRARNLALAGECPFCGQHLRDLARHVSRKHAEEAAADPSVEPVVS